MINSHSLAALFACVASKDEPRAYLRGVMYCSRTHCLVSTNGHRLIWLPLCDQIPHMLESFVIPAETVRQCIKEIGKRPRNMNAPQMLTRGDLAGVQFEPLDPWPFEDWRRVVPRAGAAEIQGCPGNLNPQQMAALCDVGSVTWFKAKDAESPVPFKLITGGHSAHLFGCVMPFRLPPAGDLTWAGAPVAHGSALT